MNSREVKDVSGIWNGYWRRVTKANSVAIQFRDPYARYFWGEHLECILPILRDRFKRLIGLEVGVGTGILLQKVKSGIEGEIVGLDVSHVAIEAAKRCVSASTLVHADTFHLPFRRALFDFVMCFGLIEHFQNSITPLRRILPLLKREGYVFISVPQRGSLYAPWKRWQIRRKMWPFGFEREFAKEDLERLCQEAGLKHARFMGIDFYPSFLKILPFEVLFRSIIVKITKWLQTKKRTSLRSAHMLMAIARGRY